MKQRKRRKNNAQAWTAQFDMRVRKYFTPEDFARAQVAVDAARQKQLETEIVGDLLWRLKNNQK